MALAIAGGLLTAPADRCPATAVGGVVVAGESDAATGMGEMARLLSAGLDAIGVPQWSVAVSGRPGRHVALPPGVAAGMPLLVVVNGPHLPIALARLGRAALRGRRVIGVWAWDLPTTPLIWRLGARCVHEIWAPSEFARAALEPMLPGLVRRVRPAVAVMPPEPSALGRAAFGLPSDAVVTLVSFNLASSRVRKNPEAAIAAHRMAFGDRADRILVLKIVGTRHYAADLADLRAQVGGAANVRVITELLPTADAHALTRAADIVLSLHRSEGFGLVPAEAMLLGRAVIATGWSGNLDFMDATTAALVPYRLVPANDPRGVFKAPGAVWAEPDIAAAAAWLVRLADDPDLRARLGACGAMAAQARLGTADLAAAIADLGLPCGC